MIVILYDMPSTPSTSACSPTHPGQPHCEDTNVNRIQIALVDIPVEGHKWRSGQTRPAFSVLRALSG